MFKLTTSKGIYETLRDLAPADLWEWAEARVKHWKVQVRWSFDPAEVDYDTLCAFAALFSATAMQTHITSKRRKAITKLYHTVRIECFIGDGLADSVQGYVDEILQGSDRVLGTPASVVDQLADVSKVSADPQEIMDKFRVG